MRAVRRAWGRGMALGDPLACAAREGWGCVCERGGRGGGSAGRAGLVCAGAVH